MGLTVTEARPVSTAKQWVAGLWTYYKRYTHSAIHAAAAAALTIFGVLVFIDPLFAGVGIAAYVCPPIVLYVLDVDIGSQIEEAASTDRQAGGASESVTDAGRESTHRTRDGDVDDAKRDSDSDGDSDSDDGDSDSDGADGDSDSDGDDGDSDSDGKDTDSDSDS